MRLGFSDVVVVEGDLVGVVVKSWSDGTHEVYVRSWNRIHPFHERKIERFVYDKELPDRVGY